MQEERKQTQVEQSSKQGGKLRKSFKKIDIYSKSISMTYKGEDKYRTTLGALVSVLVIIMLILFFCYRLVVMYAKDAT